MMTESRKIVYDAIVAYINEHQYAPTARELCELTGMKSTATIHSHITRLINDGYLETDADGAPRALRVPEYKFAKIDNGESEIGVIE